MTGFALVLAAVAGLAPPTSLARITLGNKANALSPAARSALVKDGVVVVEGREEHFFSLYDRNAYEGIPSFVSLDAVLHVVHVRLDAALVEVEHRVGLPALRAFAGGQARAALAWLDHEPNEPRARAAALYHSVPWALLEGPVDARVRDDVVAFVDGAKRSTGLLSTAACVDPVDGTRFKPRGHYAAWKLRGYFQAMTFYMACAVPLRSGAGLQRATDLVGLLDDDARAELAKVRSLVESVAGPSEKLGPDAWKGGKPPAGALGAFAFIGDADTPDAHLFERTTDPVKRPFPSALDVVAALGSADARALLPADRVQVEVDISGEDLYRLWMKVLALVVAPGPGARPYFEASSTWKRRSTVTTAASWAELRHDTLLYVKQPLVMMEGGHDAELPATRAAGYVEARPDVYAALVELLDWLNARAPGAETAELRGLLVFLGEVARLELAGEPFPRTVDERLRSIGSELERITRGRADRLPDQALVADVHGVASELGVVRAWTVGTGRVDEAWVVVPRAGKWLLTRGGVFSFYEFASEPGTRLDDDEWNRMLRAGTAPPRPSWATPMAAPVRPRPRH